MRDTGLYWPIRFFEDIGEFSPFRDDCAMYSHKEYFCIPSSRMLPFQVSVDLFQTALPVVSVALSMRCLSDDGTPQGEFEAIPIEQEQIRAEMKGTALYVSYLGADDSMVLPVGLMQLKFSVTTLSQTHDFYSDPLNVKHIEAMPAIYRVWKGNDQRAVNETDVRIVNLIQDE